MLLKSLRLSGKGLALAALVASFGGFGSAQAADAGAAAAGAGTQLPKTTVPAGVGAQLPNAPVPAAPGTMPAKPMMLPSTSAPAPAVSKPAPATGMASANIAGNPDGSCPASAPVKISKSKIYHVPEGRNYAKTKAKYCFASAEAAEQAGYRAPKK